MRLLYAAGTGCAAAFLLLAAGAAQAHQPRIVETCPVAVSQPEVSQAFYGELNGEACSYEVESVQPFNLYLSLSVPASSNPRGRYFAEVINASTGSSIARLDAEAAGWKLFYEPFGADEYLQGPKYNGQLPAGRYEVVVFSKPENRGKYVLAIGKAEEWPAREVINTLWAVPRLKLWFFNVPAATFLKSPIGAVYAFVMLAAGAAAGWVWRGRQGKRLKEPGNQQGRIWTVK